MFKNCCGCKNSTGKKQKDEGEIEKDVYAKNINSNKHSVDGFCSPKKTDRTPSVTVTAEPDVLAKSPEPPPLPENNILSDVKPSEDVTSKKDAVSDTTEQQQKECQQEEEVSGNNNSNKAITGAVTASPSDEESPEPPDTATLRALAHGMLATPHPSKRSGSIPGLGSLPQWLSQEDDDVFGEGGGTTEPPATPVGRDELALRRHRFFSDLLQVHQAATEHRVRFDPLGPTVADAGCDLDHHEARTPTVELESLLNRLEKVTTRLEQTVVASEFVVLKPGALKASSEQSKSPERTDVPFAMSVAAFENIIQGPLSSYMALSLQIGGDVASISQHVNQAFQAQLQYLTLASQSKAPTSQDENMKLLEPTSAQIRAIQDYREKHRGSQHFNHLSAISESIAALGWVTVSPAPAPYVKEMNDAGQFYTNRVLKDWKEKDKMHKAWVDSWVETLSELQKYVKQHHTTGLVWSGKAGTGGSAPPPPPGLPPPPPILPTGDVAPSVDTAAQDRSALFAEINRGEGITATLKKVTPDMQTHKNTALRAGPAPFKAPAQTSSYRSVTPSQPVEKPPNFARDGKKWLVEYQKGNHSLLIENAEMNNVVYMFKCQDSTLTIKGKVNSVVLDSCRKSSVLFDSVVSSIEFVNCQSIQMQVLNKVPTISIDKTDGCQMYLSPESMDVEIVSSKSSEMNVMVPKGNGDYLELPVPEQFKTTVSSKGLLTVAVENKGSAAAPVDSSILVVEDKAQPEDVLRVTKSEPQSRCCNMM